MENEMTVKIMKRAENISLARNVVACFMLPLNPSISELADIKTAVSEAVTNAFVHGYQNEVGYITIDAKICDKTIHISIADNGKGIADINAARQPFFTTKPDEEHTGMGFTIMETFMDECVVNSVVGKGTVVNMSKKICG